jgi:hypothetical protein
MKRLAIGFLVSFALILIAGLAYLHVSNQREREQQARAQGVIDARFAQIQRDLPVGTSHKDVIAYLQAHAAILSNWNAQPYTPGEPYTPDEQNNVVSLPIGTVPSTVWYCGNFASFANLSFVPTDSTASTPSTVKALVLETRGMDCL